MKLIHVALACRNEVNSDRFYQGLLGLRKIRSKTIPSSLAEQVFGRKEEFRIIDYADETLHFEIFVDPHVGREHGRLEHVCLEVVDLETFLRDCRASGATVLQVPKGDGGMLTFVRDYDGHLYEIKEQVPDSTQLPK
jgi:catechol 2,3-dioxygenase-like lactoylglutathione lyase family enzyme